MLTSTRTTTMLPVSDADRASRFYQEKLGLRQIATGADGSRIFAAGTGDAIGLMPAEEGAQSKHTVLSFEVDDITEEVHELEDRGVSFEDYDMPDLKTVDHIAQMGDEKAAWFCDTEGNILCIHQVTGGS
jgi:predicted enzyme related to lactoylglutathione lyase